MGPHAARPVHGDQVGQRVVDQALQRRLQLFRAKGGFEPVDGHLSPGHRHQHAQGHGIGGEERQQPQECRRLGEPLPGQGVQRQLPGAAHQLTGLAATVSGRSPVDDHRRLLAELAVVLVHGPRLQELVGKVGAGEREGERQTAQALGDLPCRCQVARVRREIAQHLGRLLQRQDAQRVPVHARSPPQRRRGVAGRDEHRAAVAGPQPGTALQDRRVVGVVEDEQPGVGGVVEVVPDEKIVLHWGAADGTPDQGGSYDTTVTMTFAALEDGRTLVTIGESGWRDTVAAQKAAFGNCEGWTGMLCALKVYIEHGINLRDGFYK